MVEKKATDADIIRVLADPDTKSIKDAAEKLGVAPDTLYKRLSEELWEEVRLAVRQAIKTEIGPIWQALVRAAKRGDIAAADRVLKRAGEYDEMDLSEQKHVVELRTKMTDEEFAELARFTADRISEKE